MLWAGCLTLAYFLVLFFCLSPYYAINDDMMIESILSGAYLRPYPYAYYLSSELGWILSLLYATVPKLPWLGLFYLFCNGACVFAVEYYALLRMAEAGWKKYALSLLVPIGFTALCFQNFVLLHYTCLAALLGSTGLVLLFLERGKGERLMSFLLLLSSYLVRENVFFLLAPFAALACLFLFLEMPSENRKGFLRELVVPCLLFLLLFGLNRGLLRGEAWKEYLSYNQLRTDVYDYYGVSTDERALSYYEAEGVTEDDVILLHSYDLALLHDGGGNKSDLEAVASYGKEKKKEEGLSLFASAKQSLRRFLRQKEDAPWNYFVILLYAWNLFCVFWKHKGKKKPWRDLAMEIGILVLLFGYRSIAWTYLLRQGRYPQRVTLSLYWMEIAFLLGFSFRSLREKAEKKLAIVYGILLGGFFLPAALWNIQGTLSIYQENQRVNQEDDVLMTYLESHEENFYLLDVYATVYRTKPVLSPDGGRKENYLWLGGWMIRHPLYLEKLDHELPGAENAWELLREKENCYLVLKEHAGISKEELEKALSISLEETERLWGERAVFVIYHAK